MTDGSQSGVGAALGRRRLFALGVASLWTICTSACSGRQDSNRAPTNPNGREESVSPRSSQDSPSSTAPAATSVPQSPSSLAISPGTVLLDADFSSGRPPGWSFGKGWAVRENGLLFDATSNRRSMVIIPELPLGRAYAVEVEVDLIRDPQGYSHSYGFGVGLRLQETGSENFKGYLAGWWWRSSGQGGVVAVTSEDRSDILADSTLDLDLGAHVLRAEVAGNRIKAAVDSLGVEAHDNRYLEPGLIAIWCYGYQLSVKSLRVTAL